jgi:hypothetical protein
MKHAADLQHRDWLLFTQQALISKVNPNISTEIVDRDNGSKVLIISDIPEGGIKDLLFITNTDNNNNYGYLEEFNVFRFGASIPLNIPGLSEIVQNIYRYSDMNAFLSKSTTHDPFNPKNFVNSSFKGQSFTKFVDELTALLPFTTDTGSITTTYQIIFNPDTEHNISGDATINTVLPYVFQRDPNVDNSINQGKNALLSTYNRTGKPTF